MFTITSPAFAEGAEIPRRFTCDGSDTSPALRWEGIPDGTRSLALIVDDPDAPMGLWVHWVLYNIPPGMGSLPEGFSAGGEQLEDVRVGRNSWGRSKPGYGGPCPPSGTHRYFFKLYALDTALDIGTGATDRELLAAMKGHVLGEAVLMGRYSRR